MASNTLPLRNRSDFNQALSNLQRLQQEAGEEPHVPPFSYKHKQWQLAQSSSSTWWNWQDSWWSSYKKEVSQVLSERGDPLLKVFGKNLRKWLSRVQFILLQLDRLPNQTRLRNMEPHRGHMTSRTFPSTNAQSQNEKCFGAAIGSQTSTRRVVQLQFKRTQNTPLSLS